MPRRACRRRWPRRRDRCCISAWAPPCCGDDQAKGLAQLIVKLNAEPKLKATISGYHSAAGTLAQNQELAKQRAFTVRDSLLAGGVKEARVILEKPQQTEANISGEDPTARRVEVTVK